MSLIELPRPGRCIVMGVLNVTPDSFSDGGCFADTPSAVAHGLEMAAGHSTGAACDVRARADQLDLRMACDGVAQLVEPFAGSGRVQPHALALCGVCAGHQ